MFGPKRCQRQNNQLNLHFNLNICGTRFRNEPMCKSQSQSWSRPEMISLSLGLDFWDFQVSVSVSSLDQTRIWSQSQSQSPKYWSRRLLVLMKPKCICRHNLWRLCMQWGYKVGILDFCAKWSSSSYPSKKSNRRILIHGQKPFLEKKSLFYAKKFCACINWFLSNKRQGSAGWTWFL